MPGSKRFNLLASAVLLIVFISTVYVTKAFIAPLLLSFFMAFVLLPVYSRIHCFTGRKNLSAFLSLLLVVLFFMIFLSSALNAIATETSGLFYSQEDIVQSIDIYITQKTEESFDTLHVVLNKLVSESTADEIVERLREMVRPFIEAPRDRILTDVLPQIAFEATNLATGFISELPVLMSQFFVAIMITYYLLIGGSRAVKEFLLVLPEREIMNYFMGELNKIYNNLFNVYLLTSLITGLLAAIGFALFGVSYPFLWGLTTAIFALLPMIGPPIIFVPICIYFLLIGNYLSGIGLFIYSLIFINTIPENVIRPKLASQGAKIHPSITLLAFAAPIFVVGFLGFIIGPLLYGFLLAAFRTRVYMLKKEGAIDEKDLAELAEEENLPPGPRFCDLGSKARSALELLRRYRN
ncbi:AI-2E family transporter [Methanothrix sp.]|jgi:predicted PurR-regulated permease PerM|uniref:AI-2E family transporter n=1 Tax=Methanothrix sp. TaxID=90426 RepID=UPI003BB63B43